MDGGANIQVLLDEASVSLGAGLGLGRVGRASFGKIPAANIKGLLVVVV
jgi:hypothetical protein